ncbi:MAG: nicotinate phosphoribosyltransferase [Clostridiales bacterium]|jgi:nicotinate phosphoribosyltransferase|nr:nicotinate phosphoribosyltransferase [Clostridiales bacterium]
MDSKNLALLTDLYELTMMQGYFSAGAVDKECIFDMFYRKNPSHNGYAVFAGLSQVIEYIKNLKFSEDDISYLKSLNLFTSGFLGYLQGYKFTGDIYAVKEGAVVFPNEPLIVVKANIMEAQLIETAILNIINHQSLIATKASRVCFSSGGDIVLEFGLRRAQGPDAGIYGSRAAVIGGCNATSNVLAGRMFDIPVRGTHAHSWVMSFDSEITAFREYAKAFPDTCIFLVDTYDTIKSGVPNAIKVLDELKAAGQLPKSYGIRLDSGDLAYLSKTARSMLDSAGYQGAIISASGDLDEYLIESLKLQGAQITTWGVGTNLITSADWPAFGGVYKLAAEKGEDGSYTPKIKISENTAKVTNPGVKKIYRLYDKKHNKMKADLITLSHEKINENEDLVIFDPNDTWKRMTLKANEFTAEELLAPIFIKGACIYETPSVMEIREYCIQQKNTLWDEYKRNLNPHVMPVDLSQELYDLKQELIGKHRG